ncbi:MAG: aldehyde dehydrogenase family protein [Chitinophagales bacterium]
MNYCSVNPFTGQLLQEYPLDHYPDVRPLQAGFDEWKRLLLTDRLQRLKKVADHLKTQQDTFARLITLEMGKPLAEARYELAKVQTAFDYYLSTATTSLAPQAVATNASQSFVAFEPLGVILCVMPWNFPFWQVFRFAIPALVAGNTVVLKHAPNVPQCAAAIADLFAACGMKNQFANFYLSNEDTAKLIADTAISGVSFTGSDATGSIIAGLAGQAIKPAVVELGGNDAFIVLADAPLETTVAGAIKSRSINSGQSCNAAKRFLVHESIYHDFLEQLITAVKSLRVGDPMQDSTQIGPLARLDLAEKVRTQIQETIKAGARAHFSDAVVNGQNIVMPTVLEEVLPGMTAFETEVFGPVWSVTRVRDVKEAINLANASVYGLGASVWTSNQAAVMPLLSELQTGNVFVNDIVKSDARLPFGGVKRSGFGRELSTFGLMEFVNVKTVYCQ